MNDSQLIFLISQPRSGSSMVQQLLLNNDDISSSPEPWQMLSLVYTYKKHFIDSGYNPKFAVNNFNRFLDSTEIKLEGYKEHLKKLALDLYDGKRNGATYFLDKTPRYYHIIDELYDLFPNAKFIFLLRNPISVFTSILDYNFNGNYLDFLNCQDRLDDLFLALRKIKEGIENHSNHIVINYEDTTHSAEKTMKEVFDYLSIPVPESTSYKLKGEFKESMAQDTKSLHLHTAPVANYIDSWKKILHTTQKKKLAIAYLSKLKYENIYFHYEIDLIIEQVRKHKPKKRTFFNIPFRLLSQDEQKLSILDINKKRLLRKFQYLQGL